MEEGGGVGGLNLVTISVEDGSKGKQDNNGAGDDDEASNDDYEDGKDVSVSKSEKERDKDDNMRNPPDHQ